MNFDFYTIVTIIAILLLIISFVTLGVIITNSSSNIVFPPLNGINPCPDFWTLSGENCLTNQNNKGSNNGNISAPTAVPKFNPSKMCDNYTSIKTHNIYWDGLTNTNSCKLN